MERKEVNYEEMLKEADNNWCAAEIIWDVDKKLSNQYGLLLALSGEIYLKYILLASGRYKGVIKEHDLLHLYNMMDEEDKDGIKKILINQPKKYQPLFDKYTLDFFFKELERNESLFTNSRYCYENYQKKFYEYFGAIYEMINAFRTYAHDYINIH